MYNISAKTIKLLEENIEEYLLDLRVGKGSLDKQPDT